tara:strand:+ start:5644 stop:6192 length:549 start_codon:yes stop_codon:yes gene_type:complete
MSSNNGLKVLEEMILGEYAENEGLPDKGHTIFLTGKEGEKELPPEYLIELLLIYDTGIFEVDTLALLFDVSINDILVFTEEYPGYWGTWEESVATMWTKSFRFYEDDLKDLSWLAKYALQRSELALKMEKTLMEATHEMSLELDEDEGWTEETLFMRVEGLIDRQKRQDILKEWFERVKKEE